MEKNKTKTKIITIINSPWVQGLIFLLISLLFKKDFYHISHWAIYSLFLILLYQVFILNKKKLKHLTVLSLSMTIIFLINYYTEYLFAVKNFSTTYEFQKNNYFYYHLFLTLLIVVIVNLSYYVYCQRKKIIYLSKENNRLIEIEKKYNTLIS